MPVKKHLDYTKKEKWIHRIDTIELSNIFMQFRKPIIIPKKHSKINDEIARFINANTKYIKVFIERPMVNPMMFNASLSAVRALESVLIILEKFELPHEYMDSRKWQKELLPKLKDKKNRHAKLKKLSLAIGKRIFPMIDFTGFDDADGLLIAEFTRRNKL